MADFLLQNIRRAELHDARAIAKLEAVCFSLPYSENAVTELLEPAYRPSFVLYDKNDLLLGYVIGQAIACEGELLRIAVNPVARRCGVASALIDTLLTALKNEACSVCFLDVRESNLAAKKLYALHGFEAFDRRRHYYRQPTEDAIVMRLAFEL